MRGTWLLGGSAATLVMACAPTPPPRPPPPTPEHPHGLDPDVCVQGEVGVGEGVERTADYIFTVDELEPFRCFSRLRIRGHALPDLVLPNLEYATFLNVLSLEEPVELAVPAARTLLHVWTHGPVRTVDLGHVDSLVSVFFRDPGPDPDLSAFGRLERIEDMWLEGPWDTYAGLTIPTTRLDLAEAEGDLEGLENLESGTIVIHESTLDSLRGLRNVRTLQQLSLADSTVLTLEGLEGLGEVEGPLTLSGVEGLADLDALSGLGASGSLTVRSLPSLTAVALPALHTVEGTLTVQGNPMLTRLELPQLETLRGALVVRDNPMLPACEVERLEAHLQASGFTGAVTNVGNDLLATCP